MKKSSCFGDFLPEFRDSKTARIVILPVPYDRTSTWIKGADKGPQAILDASFNLEFYDILTDSEVFRQGIYTDSPISGSTSVEEIVQNVRARVEGYFQKRKFPVLLGGEHSISIGAFQAAASVFENLTILQLDAHADTREEYEGSRFNHACVMARARELCPVVQVGIRSMDSEEKKNIDSSRIFYAHQILEKPRQDWIDAVTALFTENVYVTIDLDVFDPSIMAATGTPEPGGLNWMDVTALLRQVCSKTNVIGFDVAELCPRENLWACDFLAAKLVYSFLSFKYTS